mmetsp:Transcript_13382/g.31850  ORF Transcript_13382/g.31850 Transcript_13382/m.31850 type:complete len:111 (-) Transcript_13382:62-394(-)
MPAKVQQKSKAAKALAAAAGGKKKGGKKWSKGKQRDQKNNEVIFYTETYAKALAAIPRMKVITAATVSERLHITASLARATISQLASRGEIKQIVKHQAQVIYTTVPKKD